MSRDPTYEKHKINANFVWQVAFLLSELFNDAAPIGWSNYIPAAEEAVRKAKKIGLAESDPTQ